MDNNETIDLIEALETHKITIEDIIEQAKKVIDPIKLQSEYFSDGGSQIYRTSEYTILKLNRMESNNQINKDVYIGTPDEQFVF